MSLTCSLVFRRGRTQLVVVALELLLLGQDDLRRLEDFDTRAVQALGLANQLQQLHVEVDVQLPVWCARGARWTRCPSPCEMRWGTSVRVRRWHLVMKERKDEWRRKRFRESVYKRRKSESTIGSMRDEMGHQCPVRPSQLVYPPAVLGRKGTRNPIPLSALSRMRKRRARCDGDAVALERAPWTLVQEWRERVTCLVVARSKLNGLVGLLY